MSRLVIALIAAVTLLGVAGAATGRSVGEITDRYEGRLTPEQVVPSGVQSDGVGEFFGIYIKEERALHWVLRYGDLTGPGPATAARIHLGPKGENGGVLIRLCGQRPRCRRPSRGEIRLTPAQAQAFMRPRPLYVTLSTAKYPEGEIRGQVEPPKLQHGCAPC